MDIGSGKGWPADKLSNFSPHPFVFRGVECSSMEGLLQAFKFDKTHVQAEVCKLVGLTAKRRGSKRNRAWKSRQTLWWDGVAYDRHGDEYQALLDDAFEALCQNEGFRRALIATGSAVLTHAIGKNDPRDTVLTQREFCSRLTKLRAKIKD